MGRDALIQLLKDEGSLIMGDDGCWLFWPATAKKGGLSSTMMTQVAEWMSREDAKTIEEMDRWYETPRTSEAGLAPPWYTEDDIPD